MNFFLKSLAKPENYQRKISVSFFIQLKKNLGEKLTATSVKIISSRNLYCWFFNLCNCQTQSFLRLPPENTLCTMDNKFSDKIQTRYHLQ